MGVDPRDLPLSLYKGRGSPLGGGGHACDGVEDPVRRIAEGHEVVGGIVFPDDEKPSRAQNAADAGEEVHQLRLHEVRQSLGFRV